MYTGKFRIPTNRFCFKCHHRVFHSDVKGYPYVCPHYGFGICTSNLKEEISLPGLMELISQAPELKERVNTFMNDECGGAFKDSYDILTSYVEQYGIQIMHS